MKRYLTAPIYYSGGTPHLGHVYTMRLADCARRAAVLAGADTPLVTGTGNKGRKSSAPQLARTCQPPPLLPIAAPNFVSCGRNW